ncbi:MAG: hydrogenase maturation nickel metallochaperone HypA [Acidiphilium sp.]|nr:hydrogenase maturation nickel metallochaperone HypA [Acidiphilium sp.]MDD4937260.1 hydrogenase maturation nickel metallochaperone HypA [Acidiphilium sp.]
MHEMSIAESLVELIEEAGRNQRFLRVRQIRVKLGALGHVEPEALRFCFDAVSQGTIAESAELDLEMVAGEGWCASCSRTVPISERYDLCPVCGQDHVRMTAGDELRLAELEVE